MTTVSFLASVLSSVLKILLKILLREHLRFALNSFFRSAWTTRFGASLIQHFHSNLYILHKKRVPFCSDVIVVASSSAVIEFCLAKPSVLPKAFQSASLCWILVWNAQVIHYICANHFPCSDWRQIYKCSRSNVQKVCRFYRHFFYTLVKDFTSSASQTHQNLPRSAKI